MESRAELEVTWRRATRIWWAYTWRSMIAIICAVVLGGIAGGVIGGISYAMGADLGTGEVLGGIAGGVLGLLSQIVVIRVILNRNYGELRLALVPSTD
ncbi:hypothetical protein OAJ07_06910 [Gemmatimonadales bacterium]|nr:hypothetical protein [Gemmatimonadales bacterium]